MVNVNCTGGGGYFSSDMTATKAHVVKGHSTITHDSNDEIVEGTMIDVADNDVQKSNTIANNNLYLRMTNGAHRKVNSISGFPEVSIPLSSLRSTIGFTDTGAVLEGTTIAGTAGTMPNKGAWNGKLELSGSVTIPKGYHNGSGMITRSYTVHAGGIYTPSSKDQNILTSGRLVTSNINCKGDANLVAANIANGVSIFGVTGSMMKYTAGNDSVIFNGGTWQNQMRRGMTPVCYCHYSGSVSGGSYSRDDSSYLQPSSTDASGHHIDHYASYSSGSTLNCSTAWKSWQGNDDDEYGFGVVYLRANQTFNPALYSGINIVRDFYGSGRENFGQQMSILLYDTNGTLVSSGSTTLYPTYSYSPWKIENSSYTWTFPKSVYSYSQLRLVLKFRNTETGSCDFTSAIKTIKLVSK